MLNLLGSEIPKGTETTLRVEQADKIMGLCTVNFQGYQTVTCPERSEEIAEHGLVRYL